MVLGGSVVVVGASGVVLGCFWVIYVVVLCGSGVALESFCGFFLGCPK